MTTPREVPPCKPWCGKGGFCDVNHPGACLSGSSSKLDDPCLCSEACAEAGRALNPPPSSPPPEPLVTHASPETRCVLAEMTRPSPSSPPSEGVPAKRLELTVRPWAPGFMQLGFAEAVGHSDIDLALRTAGFQDGDRIVIALAPAASPQSEAAPALTEAQRSSLAEAAQYDGPQIGCGNAAPAAPRPGKPTAVAVGQRWRFDGSAYQVTDGPRYDGDYMTDWDDEGRMWLAPNSILRDEYLGMAASAAWKARHPLPATPAAYTGPPLQSCPTCGEVLGDRTHVCPVKVAGNVPFPDAAAAPGAPEMTLGEAVANPDGVEIKWPGMEWKPLDITETCRVANASKARFRRRPAAPPPVQRSRVRELAEAFAKEKGWTAPAWVEHCNEVGERVAQMAADWIREAEGNGVADDFLAFTRGRLSSTQGGGK